MITEANDEAARVEAIAQAFVSHWSHFGRYPGATLHDEDGVTWFESPIAHLPYNAVIRTSLGADADAVIAKVIARFGARKVPFMWVVRPGDTPDDLGARLEAHGVGHVERVTGMDLDLAGWQPEPARPGVEVRTGDSPDLLTDYEALIRTYWSVPEEEREQIKALNRYWSGERNPGARFVAYADGAPVGKLILNLVDLPFAGVYGVAVLPEARGRGIATALMCAGLSAAIDRGATRAVLHSSPMARSMYLRMGFTPRCDLDAYATAPLRGTHHH